MNIKTMQDISQMVHSRCFACGDQCNEGLDLKFGIENENVVSSFQVNNKYQGYDGIVHGGITASILDCAMVHCLFALGIKALTIELSVKYRYPVEVDTQSKVQAWLVSESHELYHLKARLYQGSSLKAEAKGRFYRPNAIRT